MFVPFVGRDTEPREAWYTAFLRHLSANGGRPLAAAHVNIAPATLKRALQADADFAEEVEAAESFDKSLLEWELVDLGGTKNNVLSYFGRLKAELPARYVEKAITVNVNVTAEVPPADVRELLRHALAGNGMTDATRRALETDSRTLAIAPTPEAAPEP